MPGRLSMLSSCTFLSSIFKKSVLTVILFSVIVPVLSVQMTVVEPRVSTDSSFLIRAFLFAILFEAIPRQSVTVGSSPSGTLATIMPMANIMLPMSLFPMSTPIMKNVTPRAMAIIEMILMKWFSSFLRGLAVSPIFFVSPAILPI